MIKLKVSYQEEKELQKLLLLLSGEIKKVKRSKNTEGQFKKAYIELKED